MLGLGLGFKLGSGLGLGLRLVLGLGTHHDDGLYVACTSQRRLGVTTLLLTHHQLKPLGGSDACEGLWCGYRDIGLSDYRVTGLGLGRG